MLHIVRPVDFASGGYRAAEDVTLEFAFTPLETANHAHLRFNSPLRENTVTQEGEMMFDSGRQYCGIWYVHSDKWPFQRIVNLRTSGRLRANKRVVDGSGVLLEHVSCGQTRNILARARRWPGAVIRCRRGRK